VSQEEWGKVVDLHRRLQTIDGALFAQAEHPHVVDQDVEALLFLFYFFGEASDAG
jgi:hypothetical protein